MIKEVQKKVEKAVGEYADLVLINIEEAADEIKNDKKMLESEKLSNIYESIRMLNHVCSALERIDHIRKSNLLSDDE